MRTRPSQGAPRWVRRVRWRVALADAVAVYLAVLVAFAVRFGGDDVGAEGPPSAGADHAATSLALVAGWLAALWFAGTLSALILGAGSPEYTRVSTATLAVFGAAAVIAYLSRWDVGRAYVAVALPLGLVLLAAGRSVMRRVLVAERRAGQHLTRALAVGSAEHVAHLVAQVAHTPQAGIEVVAACTPGGGAPGSRSSIAGVPVVGDVPAVVPWVGRHRVDAVVVTGSDDVTPATLRRLAWGLEPHGVRLVVSPGLTDVAHRRLRLWPLPTLALVHLKEPGYTAGWLRLKRAVDVVGATALLILFAVPLLAAALAVRCTSPGPVLFRQTRIGVDGHPFTMLKFRSMVVGAEDRLDEVLDGEAGMFYKPKDDPRVTRVGAFLRRYSVDELPQLFNVLGGSMSLVGPRPQVPLEVEQYDDAAARRLLVRPGLTGLWQVSGRNNLTPEQSVRLDLYYVENWTLVEDLLILARTMRAVVGRDGAY